MPSKRVLAAILVALPVGYVFGALTPRPIEAKKSYESPNDSIMAVRVNRPEPSNPKGRQSTMLSVWRVTGGPEGTIEYRKVPEVTAPDGTRDFAINGTDLWVISIGQRSYILGPRD